MCSVVILAGLIAMRDAARRASWLLPDGYSSLSELHRLQLYLDSCCFCWGHVIRGRHPSHLRAVYFKPILARPHTTFRSRAHE